MSTEKGSLRRTPFDDTYFERKARELVVADEEIEAWELDASAFDGLAGSDDLLEPHRYE